MKRSGLDQPSVTHHRDPIGDLRDHAHVMGDETARRCRGPVAGRGSASRICFWLVTSSAVVGSSAISSFGSSTSAIAIMMRWRWPPDSRCG